MVRPGRSDQSFDHDQALDRIAGTSGLIQDSEARVAFGRSVAEGPMERAP